MSYWFDDIAPAFVELVERARDEHGAPVFASDLAIKGAQPEALRTMARRWRECEFEPAAFAGEIEAVADIVEQVCPRDRANA